MFDLLTVKYPLPVKGAPRHYSTKDFPDPAMDQFRLGADGIIRDVYGHRMRSISGEVEFYSPWDSSQPTENWGWLEFRAFFVYGELCGPISVVEDTRPAYRGILGWLKRRLT